jgi:hypothetical protein
VAWKSEGAAAAHGGSCSVWRVKVVAARRAKGVVHNVRRELGRPASGAGSMARRSEVGGQAGVRRGGVGGRGGKRQATGLTAREEGCGA